MALYEHVFLARQDLSQQQVDALVEQYKGIIEAGGGSFGKVENWGLKSLAFRIKKNRKAYYTLIDIDAPPAAVAEMERQMGLSEDVLRFMTVKVDEHEEGPSAMMQKRDDRGPRDRDRGPRGDRDRGDRGDRGDRDRGPRPPRDNQFQGEGASA
ncbi:MAG: 30S ribosomal protein S6 [Aliihoeflea sp.]|jgi:small subunit ribosomal protein S6